MLGFAAVFLVLGFLLTIIVGSKFPHMSVDFTLFFMIAFVCLVIWLIIKAIKGLVTLIRQHKHTH